MSTVTYGNRGGSNVHSLAAMADKENVHMSTAILCGVDHEKQRYHTL